ncbi:hypothetical protein BU26DRAFT_502001 [Trematosphaeria pertusa]|uniref:MATH and UCH domain protein n=1 Tax=Trematosphaeria pertusa TaxID=390896 RepID=A0A6A6ITN1_9PLEO|nr:uncharacterized protein BU26DRAFT_502001 [Trematosphaeria pertusa]KAF2253885.1 hypothetical protein BU26DRAFT_502001 [Trematosphaeria pertusa]
MSVANVEQPPPLLFGQQPPSSPPFSSPQSPNEAHHAQHPSSPPPQSTNDVDMSASTTFPPAGQRHDRDDAAMQDGLTNGVQADTNSGSREPPNNVAVEVAAVPADEDAMDTTPDNSQGLVLPNGSADPQEATGIPQSSPAPNGVAQDTPQNSEQAPPAPNGDAPQTDNVPPAEVPPPADPTLQPPPPPPPVEPARTDSDSSDDDDGAQPWHPIPEDTSSPDETELKEIEASTEVSALDHEHWEKRAFLPLDDPEYAPGASGRIEWTIDNYNGTREKPNRELVMKSEPVTIGGYEWQIKFYPKGNDSEYLSVYVECLSVGDKEQKKEDAPTGTDSTQGADAMVTAEEVAPPGETQHTPLPLLDSTTMPKRKSVAAQVSVVLYNPGEPRVNYSRTCLHRFCSASPDWGWTRFHGPYYDIPHRIRGQRQALLRDDKLAFTGYIRIINDETNCLWEHASAENPWDSFAMTGLQSLTLGEGSTAPGGNMISAIASWMMFKPFRQFLYSFTVPDPETDTFAPPKPLIGALQKVLFMLRTQVQPGAGSVTLDDVLDALEWYGIQERLDKLDVIEIWEILRLKVEEELQNTPFVDNFEVICGPKRDYANGVPSYRASVVGVRSIQEAINASPNLTLPAHPLPQLLTVELGRQEFDTASRSYVKLLNKVALDDHINVQGTPYTLYGFIMHKQTLQSYIYHPILRPEGPGSKWYSYTDSRDGNMVKCLTKRQAVTMHEGKPGSDRIIGNDPIAYIAMYVRDDVAESVFTSHPDSEQWQVPNWIRKDVEKQQTTNIPPPIPPPVLEEQPSQSSKEVEPVAEPAVVEEQDFQVIDSQVFLQHEGPGIFDAYSSKWQSGSSEFVCSVKLKATDGCKEIREKLATTVKAIKDPRQIKFWFLDPTRGSIGRPNLLGTGKIEYSSGSYDRYADQSIEWNLQDSPYSWTSRRIWIHVIDAADLPELPKEGEHAPSRPQAEQGAASAPNSPPNDNSSAPVVSAVPESDAAPQPEDTPMSEPDEPMPQPPEVTRTEAPAPVPPSNPEGGDTAMIEVEAASVPDPPAVDVEPSNVAADTEMGGTQEDLHPPPLPPLPPTDLQIEPAPPQPIEPRQTPPPQREERQQTPPPPPDEIYFFLKFFDPEKQSLEARGSYIAQKAARVDTAISAILDLPFDKKIELCEEEELTTTRPIKGRRSFAQNDLHNTTIIVYSFPQTTEQRDALAARAAFADLQPYLAFRAQARNFPSKLNGHFTHNYFSSQYYKGEIKNGHRHGHGFRIYHSGATYEGTFRLSQRHGHGLYTFQNGDTYDGDWVANQQHGSGTFVEAATGNTYVGGWKNDKKFGEGVTHWKNAQETERLCRICWEEGADAAFYDCGHVVACLQCARQVENCPVCRKRVLSAMKLYYVA